MRTAVCQFALFCSRAVHAAGVRERNVYVDSPMKAIPVVSCPAPQATSLPVAVE